jgi:protein phosphatase
MSLSLRFVAHSEIGLVRKNNQDSGYASPTMLIVADGMGGAAAGDLASAVAVTELERADGHYEGEEMLDVLADAIAAANDAIADLVVDDHSLEGMGTTVCGGMFDGERIAIAHIGDSRGYIVRDAQLKRLTRDHSWVQQLIDEGRISEEEALTHPHRSLILRVLNGQPIIEPEFDLIELKDGDRLLFCSDGLCGVVDDEQIAVALENPHLDQVLEILVDAAHNGGGPDNITIVLADVVAEAVTQEPMVLGAAATRSIPVLQHTPISLDELTADTDESATDKAGNRLPRAPQPVDPEDTERARYNPTVTRKKGRWFRLTLAIVVPILAIVAGIGAWYGYTRTLYFVGASDDVVAIFQGVPDQIGGFALYEVHELQDTRVTDLPPLLAERVREREFPTGSLEDAHATASELKRFSQECIRIRQDRAQATETPTSDPTVGSPSPTAGVTTAASPTQGGSPSTTISAPPSSAPPTTSTPTNPTEGC